jgi:hypothetical protein
LPKLIQKISCSLMFQKWNTGQKWVKVSEQLKTENKNGTFWNDVVLKEVDDRLMVIIVDHTVTQKVLKKR